MVFFEKINNRDSFLTDKDVETFYKQGYVIKKGAINNKIEKLTESADKIVSLSQDQIKKADGDSHVYYKATQIVSKKKSDTEMSIKKVVGCAGMVSDLLCVLRSNKMMMTFFKLLQCDKIEHLVCEFQSEESDDEAALEEHCDLDQRKAMDQNWKDVTGKGSYAVCLIAIKGMSQENGGLFIRKSSHQMKSSSGAEDVVRISLDRGDMIFMHPNLTHWSAPDSGKETRWTFLTGFCAYGANSVGYPAAFNNYVSTLQSDLKINIQPAPWKSL